MDIVDCSSHTEKVSLEYVSPNVEVIEVEIEKGFSASDGPEHYKPENGTWD